MSARPEAFERARSRVQPLLQGHGFRPLSLEREEDGEGNAFAEYGRGSLRIRLVWEGRERALWLEAARQAGTQVVSRWQDVEWTVAGTRLPLDPGLDQARMERLADALTRFLDQPEARVSAGA